MSENKKSNIGVSIFLFLIAITLIGFSLKRQFDLEKTNEELSEKISQQVSQEVVKKVDEATSKPSDFPDFNSLSRLQRLIVVDNFKSWTPETKLQEDKIKKVIVLDRGSLSKGYVYIRISLDEKALTKWESIYMKLNDSGGHLFRKESLAVPPSEKTEILYALDSIPYLQSTPYSEMKVPFYADWFQLFRNDEKIKMLAFISSLRPALIEEISFYYQCVENDDCHLSIENAQP